MHRKAYALLRVLLLGAPLAFFSCERSSEIRVGKTAGGAEVRPAVAATTPEPAPDWGIVFLLLDHDGNGVFDAADLAALAKTEDRDGNGKIDAAEFTRVLGTLAHYGTLHSEGPAPGTPAPDVKLTRLSDGQEILLSSLYGERPVLILFGSVTCADAREQLHQLGLAGKALSGVRVVFIYLREAHPDDGLGILAGSEGCREPLTLVERRAAAGRLTMPGGADVTFLVDSMADRAAMAYGAWPTRLYLVGKDGKIRFRGRRFPPGNRLAEILPRLRDLLVP